MKEVTTKLYKFKELSLEVQKKVLEEEMQSQYEFFCDNSLFEILEEEATRMLKIHFKEVEDLKLLYDFSYSQGSGLLTEFTFTFKDEKIVVKQNPNNHWYTFNSNFVLDYDEFYSKLTAGEVKSITKEIKEINQELERVGYSMLEDEEMFKELALEYLEGLDEEFTKEGKYYNF